jgi:hypothetical protein
VEGIELRDSFADLAYKYAEDKKSITKTIHVSRVDFEACIADLNDCNKAIARRRGFIQAYHKCFWRQNPEGQGKTYCAGIIFIISEDFDVETSKWALE